MSEPFCYTFDFSLNKKDAETFLLNHAKKTPYFKHWYRLIWFIVPIILVFFLSNFFNDFINPFDSLRLAFGLIVMYIFWILISPLYLLIHKQVVKTLIQSKPMQYLIDIPQTLILDQEGVINKHVTP